MCHSMEWNFGLYAQQKFKLKIWSRYDSGSNVICCYHHSSLPSPQRDTVARSTRQLASNKSPVMNGGVGAWGGMTEVHVQPNSGSGVEYLKVKTKSRGTVLKITSHLFLVSVQRPSSDIFILPSLSLSFIDSYIIWLFWHFAHTSVIFYWPQGSFSVTPVV